MDFGNIRINDSILVRASKATDGALGGNARFWFGQSTQCKYQCNTRTANLTIFRSSFIQGLKGSIGIEIIIDCPAVYVSTSNVNVVNNTGGNIVLSLTNFDVYAPTSSKVHIMDSIINGGRANTGGGVRVSTQHSKEDRCVHDNCTVDTPSALLIISNTNFSFNSAKECGGAIYISHYQGDRYFCQVKIVKI